MPRVLPKPEAPFAGKIERLSTDSQPARPEINYPPQGAPNVVIVMFDIEKTVPFIFSMSGETFDIGEDTGAPVGPYEHGFPFSGTIKKVEIELTSGPDQQSKETVHQGQLQAALGSQ